MQTAVQAYSNLFPGVFRMKKGLVTLLLLGMACMARADDITQGYYRYPALRGDTLVFTSQGDLWKVSVKGGQAQQLTSHPGEESHAALSPDGKWVAFLASYEGPEQLYVMPVDGGLPKRLSFSADDIYSVCWTPDGKVLVGTNAYSTLPDIQLVAVDPNTMAQARVPLSQAADGCYDPTGKTLFFTRLPFQGSHTKHYKGGTAQTLWKYAAGAAEAIPLTAKYVGTSKAPMWWKGRVYFVSDRDGTMNLWSMDENGGDLKQLTHHDGWDVQSPCLDNGRIVYQMGADLRLYTIATGGDGPIKIAMASDFDQMREKWVTRPSSYLTALDLAPDGSRVALTARGQVFVAPVPQGRIVETPRKRYVRYRSAQFDGDGKSLLVLSDESGETEWWRLPVNGIGAPARLTSDASVLRTAGAVSPDSRWIAYADKNQDLWLFNVADKKTSRIATSAYGEIGDLHWSPDSKWLAYVFPVEPFDRIMLYSIADGRTIPLTTPRADSFSPAWSADGKWLYFLSNRTFRSLIGSPWGARQPEPYFDKQTKIYAVALTKGQRSPFLPEDELHPNPAEPPKTTGKPTVAIATDGLAGRLTELPVPPGNYGDLAVNGSRLYWMSREATPERKASLNILDIGNGPDNTPKTLLDDVRQYRISQDGKKLLIQKGDDLFVIDAGASAPTSLDKKKVDLSGWTLNLDPREEWRQMFNEAWRLERDYFYDRSLYGLNWPAVRQKYLPLVERVRDRSELSDLLAQMVSELSALHIFVVGGDTRSGSDNITPASLGATLTRDAAQGGYRITRIYVGDPDYPDSLSPLAKPGVEAAEGDVILAFNGVSLLDAPDPSALLRGQTGKQVLLRLKDGKTGQTRDVIVRPIGPGAAFDLRYTDWEVSCRSMVEKMGDGQIGYVHLQAMGSDDIARWARDFYPVFNRQGLIIDVRHNGGGNIDSWILEKLLRRAWFYWQPRVGNPYWNMQWAFRGHVVVLCDEHTASDGEAFTEGFKRLGLGKVIGTRTWGGEIWLSFDNTLVDNGIASAAEYGVYGPEGRWLIEQHGVDPDMVVDNLPHATFLGEDEQLKAAVVSLQKQIQEHPVPVPPAPRYPRYDLSAKR
jgi:tricorn protease